MVAALVMIMANKWCVAVSVPDLHGTPVLIQKSVLSSNAGYALASARRTPPPLRVLVKTTIPVFFIAVQISVSSILLWIGRMTKTLKIKPLSWATAKTIWPLLVTNTLSIL